ncbi:MAG: hypothetical protein H6537_07520 [Bacteroidales bacterium]|nr:hypothetical protein [Bacteroidales bacterium]HPD95582.1 hypothetical protein [Tenuifilaceae bacterium]
MNINFAMDDIEVYASEYANVTYNSKSKSIIVKWHGNVSSKEYIRAIETALDYQKKYEVPIHNYISDIRGQGIVSPESRKWFEKNAIPRAVSQGLLRAGVVLEGNFFKKYYLNMILQVSKAYKLPLKFFNSFEEAIDWASSFED